MAGVKLDDSRARVLRVLRTPTRTINGTNDFGRYTEFRYPNGLRVNLQGRTSVTAVSTTGRTQRTRTGVGVGSSEGAVLRGVPGTSCSTYAAVRLCTLGRQEPGARITDFVLNVPTQIRPSRVTRVTVGFLID